MDVRLEDKSLYINPEQAENKQFFRYANHDGGKRTLMPRHALPGRKTVRESLLIMRIPVWAFLKVKITLLICFQQKS
jgi:hypothetical protein